MAIERTF
jgi:nucleoside-diphosphate kinase